MARDGSGNFSRAVTPPVNGDVANATDYNTEQNDIASALSDSINKSGTKAFAANQPMGGKILTGLGAGANNGESVRFEQLASSLAAAVGVSVQAYDATLAALAALSWSSGKPVIQFTAADTVSLTSVLSMGDGSNTAPSYAFANDPNTGMYSFGADDIGFTIGGTALVRFGSYGVLAIGGSFYCATTGSAGTPNYIMNSADPDNGWYYIGTNNWAGSVGGTKFVDIGTALVAFAVDVQANAPLSTETTGTLTIASANKHILATGGITLPNAVFAARNIITIDGNGTARTITRGASVTMYVNGVDSATATLAANGIMSVYWRTSAICILSGNVA